MELDFEPVEERRQGWGDGRLGGYYCLTCGYGYGPIAPTCGVNQHHHVDCIKFLREELDSIRLIIERLEHERLL